jgi:hypothetical protein
MTLAASTGSPTGCFVHEARQQILIEAAQFTRCAPASVDRPFDHHRELWVVARALADIAGIDAVWQGPGAVRKVGEELVPVEMKS